MGCPLRGAIDPAGFDARAAPDARQTTERPRAGKAGPLSFSALARATNAGQAHCRPGRAVTLTSNRSGIFRWFVASSESRRRTSPPDTSAAQLWPQALRPPPRLGFSLFVCACCHRASAGRPGLDSPTAKPIFSAMSVTRELRRRLSADRSLPRFEPCLPLSTNVRYREDRT